MTREIPIHLAAPPHRPCEMVGRSTELAGLARIIDGVTTGTEIVRITGDPWMGKTRLLGQFMSTALERGWTVLSGSADAGFCGPQTGVPFHAVADALDELMVQDRHRLLDELPADQQRCLTDIFPALDTVRADGEPDDRDATTTVHAIHAVLRSLHCPGGLLLVIDDAHFADQWSLDLFARLAHHPPAERFVLALAYRGRQVDVHTSGIFDELATSHRTHVVEVGCLSDADAQSLLPADLSRCHGQELLRDCGGNPGVLRALAAVPTQLSRMADRIYYLPRESLAAGFREFRAVSRLGWLTARATAIAGGCAAAELIKFVAELTETEVWMALDELTANDVLRYDDTTHRFDFRDALVQAAACRSAGPGWRIGAHRRAATWLKEHGATPAALAHHLLESGDTHDPASVETLRSAATDLLWHRPAYALSLARAIGSRQLVGRCLTLTGPLVEACRELGGQDAVWQSRAARLLGDFATASAVVRAASDRSHAELVAIALERGVEPADADVAALRTQDPDPASLALLSQVHARRREWDEAQAHAADAALLCDTLTDDEIIRQPDTLLWLGRAEGLLGRQDQARRHLERAAGIAERRALIGLIPHPAIELAGLANEDVVARQRYVDLATEAARLLGSEYLLGLIARLTSEERPELERLSERELEIAVLVSEGRTNQQIARTLQLSHKTVETYLARIFKKLQVCSRTQIATMIGRRQREWAPS